MTTVTPANASTPIEEDLAGKVAVIDRGEVSFVHKAKAAQDKGAIAVIIVNTDDELLGLGKAPGSDDIAIMMHAGGTIGRTTLKPDTISKRARYRYCLRCLRYCFCWPRNFRACQ